MSTPLSADPWASVNDEPTVRHTTREERAREIALFLYDTTVNDTAEADRLAQRILNITYPEVSTEAELDALPAGTVIVSASGVTRTKVDRKRSRDCWVQNVSHDLRNGYGDSSAGLVNFFGEKWTVVHQVIA